jgi:hypothetical protein
MSRCLALPGTRWLTMVNALSYNAINHRVTTPSDLDHEQE